MKVYVVTSGEYSSYMINAVRLDKEEAKKLAEFYNGEVETYDTEDDSDKVKDQYLYRTEIRERWDKNTWNFFTNCAEISAYSTDNQPLNKIIKDYSNFYSNNIYYTFYTYAKDSKHAEKIAQDAFAKYRAEREGLT